MKNKLLDSFGRPARIRKGAFVNSIGYRGASYSKSRSLLPGDVTDSKNELNNFTRIELLRRSRFLKKNVGMIRGVEKSLTNQSIGKGIFPIPDTGDDAIDELYLQYFHLIAGQADIAGRLSFWDLQRARTSLKFFDGDCFTLLTRNNLTENPAFQLFRAHNCDNFEIPKTETDAWHQGVKLGAFNRPVAYRLRGKNGKFFSVPARSLKHHYKLEEPDQIRGVTALAHAIEDLTDILDVLDLEKLAVKDNARVSRVITNQSGEEEGEGGDFPNQATNEAAETHPDDLLPLEKVFGGEILRLKMGEKLESYSSARPSATFTGFIDYLGRSVTAGCGFPYEFAWDPRNITGPGMRFVISKVKHACRDWQESEIKDSIPFYSYVIADGIERGILPDTPNKFRAEWIAGVEEMTIDEGRRDKSDQEKIAAELLTRKRYYASRGLYWKKEIRQSALEKKFIAENVTSVDATAPQTATDNAE